MTKLAEIEGVGQAYSTRLESFGITSQENLLEKCCTKKGRKELADESDISENLLLEWVNRVDLARVKGVSTQYADLLENAGVDSIPELAQRNADNLHMKMMEVNEEKHLVRKVPSKTQVEDWVGQAKELPRVVSH